MSYFIFTNNSDGQTGALYRIAENQYDLNNLNIVSSFYKIIEVSNDDFNSVKLGLKEVLSYENNVVKYNESPIVVGYQNETILKNYIANVKNCIKQFLNNNLNHPNYSKYNDYYNQLSNFNTTSISYPSNKSLEQHFLDLNQPSFNPLQIA
jgi:hypothetical protein